MAADTCQYSQHICAAAASARERAWAMQQRTRRARQRRHSDQVAEPWGERIGACSGHHL